jgi:hypothetical protein
LKAEGNPALQAGNITPAIGEVLAGPFDLMEVIISTIPTDQPLT